MTQTTLGRSVYLCDQSVSIAEDGLRVDAFREFENGILTPVHGVKQKVPDRPLAEPKAPRHIHTVTVLVRRRSGYPP